MKTFFLPAFAVLAALCCRAQMPAIPTNRVVGLSQLDYLLVPKVLVIPADTLTYGSDSVGMLAKKDGIVYIRIAVNGVKKFVPMAGSSAAVPPGPVTSMPYVGMTHSTTDLETFVKEAFFRARPPTASITGGNTYELMADGANLTYSLTWTAGRDVSTATLQSIVVGGVAQAGAANVAAGAATGGSQNVSVVRNATTTLSIVVTASDGQTATASTTIAGAPKRYFGWVTSASPNDAAVIAAGGELSSSNAKTWTQDAPGGSKYLVYAYPASLGNLTHFDINGFPSIAAMQLTQRNLTNAAGYTQLYNIYVSINAFTVTGSTSIVAN